MANEQVKELMEIDPHHELLKYWILREEDLVDGQPPSKEVEKAVTEEFYDRFWNRETPWREEPIGIKVRTVVATNYMFALKEEITKLKASAAPVSG
jgi:hypothetical protein